MFTLKHAGNYSFFFSQSPAFFHLIVLPPISPCPQCVYFGGVIDILQEWNALKKSENFFKGMRYDAMTISAVAPDIYAERMVNFFQNSLE